MSAVDSLVDSLGAPVRRAIFEALVAMAWADARLEREEIMAVQAAGRGFGLPDDALAALDAGAPSVSEIARDDLATRDRELVFLCAAWLSCVDGREELGEEGLLSQLAEALAIESVRATTLRDDARMVHATVPASATWWEELRTLIDRAAAHV